MLTEGAQACVGWKSPHYVYSCAFGTELKLQLRDIKLSDDICLRFSNADWEGFPLLPTNTSTALQRCQRVAVVNIFLELSASHRAAAVVTHSRLPAACRSCKIKGITFSTPLGDLPRFQECGHARCSRHPVVVDEERDVRELAGQSMQREALKSLRRGREGAYCQ
jgi:alpha-amylase